MTRPLPDNKPIPYWPVDMPRTVTVPVLGWVR
jgi:hypothetical protein